MTESLPAWVGDIAPVPLLIGMVWGFYWLLSSGRIFTKSMVDLIIASHAIVIIEKDKIIASQERQILALLDTGETTKHVLESLRAAGNERVVTADASSTTST